MPPNNNTETNRRKIVNEKEIEEINFKIISRILDRFTKFVKKKKPNFVRNKRNGSD